MPATASHGLKFYSGKEFYAWCQSTDSRDQRACEAYICGVLDAWSMQSQVQHTRPFPYCLPVGTTCKYLRGFVVDYLAKDPTALRFAGGSAVAYPLVKTVPLPDQRLTPRSAGDGCATEYDRRGGGGRDEKGHGSDF